MQQKSEKKIRDYIGITKEEISLNKHLVEGMLYQSPLKDPETKINNTYKDSGIFNTKLSNHRLHTIDN